MPVMGRHCRMKGSDQSVGFVMTVQLAKGTMEFAVYRYIANACFEGFGTELAMALEHRGGGCLGGYQEDISMAGVRIRVVAVLLDGRERPQVLPSRTDGKAVKGHRAVIVKAS